MIVDGLDSLDVFVRHQIYVEGYKNGREDDTDNFMTELAAILLLLLSGKSDIADMSKRDMTQFVSTVTKRVSSLLSRYGKRITAELKDFLFAEIDIVKSIYTPFTPRKIIPKNPSTYWKRYLNEINPAYGAAPRAIVKTFLASALADIQKAIRQSYANKFSVADTIRNIVGTKALGYKDGVLRKIRNQFVTALNTLIQQITSFLVFEIGRLAFDRYQWVSVIDSRTTDICRGRDGKVYEYGKGPRPPAHYNCRSTIQPYVEADNDNMPTYRKWIERQPVAVQNDILGARRATALRKGEITAEALAKFDGTKSLTLGEYKSKRNLMLTTSQKKA